MSEEKYKYTGPTIFIGENADIRLKTGQTVEAEVNNGIAHIASLIFENNSIQNVDIDVAAKYLEPVNPEPISFQLNKDHYYFEKLNRLCKLNGLKMEVASVDDKFKVSVLNPDGSEVLSVTESPLGKAYEYAFDFLNINMKENGGKYYKGDAIFPLEEGFKLVSKDLVRKWEEANRWDSISEGWDKICQSAWREKYGDTYYTPKKVMDAINDDFDAILSEMSDTHKAKNHDYGDSFTELYKECGSTYAYAHLKEKLSRIKTLRKSRQQVKQESLRDSLLDLASYSVMWIVELDKKGEEDERR